MLIGVRSHASLPDTTRRPRLIWHLQRQARCMRGAVEQAIRADDAHVEGPSSAAPPPSESLRGCAHAAGLLRCDAPRRASFGYDGVRRRPHPARRSDGSESCSCRQTRHLQPSRHSAALSARMPSNLRPWGRGAQARHQQCIGAPCCSTPSRAGPCSSAPGLPNTRFGKMAGPLRRARRRGAVNSAGQHILQQDWVAQQRAPIPLGRALLVSPDSPVADVDVGPLEAHQTDGTQSPKLQPGGVNFETSGSM